MDFDKNNIKKDIEGNYENTETQTGAKKYNSEKFAITILIITIAVIVIIITTIIKVAIGIIDTSKLVIDQIDTQIREIGIEETPNL